MPPPTRYIVQASLLVLWALTLLVPRPAAAQSQLAPVPPIRSCAALADTDLAAIAGAGSAVTATEETLSDGIAVCRVTATLAPAITLEVLLPTRTWAQRYLQVGCGGLCGRISLRSGASNGCALLTDGGFVMAATDMGHAGDDSGAWGLDAQKRRDFAYRAQHLTAKAAKALITAFYGQPARYAYFNGCSDGGREALMEAQRYPEDFDGIIAGAPAMLFTVQNTLYHGWQAVSNTGADGTVTLLSDRLPLLHKAVLAACDALDGAEDGLISTPAACHFDPASLICPAGQSDHSACLTAAEAEVARRFYQGPTDPETHQPLTAGQPLYGSELNWAGVYVADQPQDGLMSTNAALPAIRYLAFDPARPEADLASFAFTRATLEALRARHPLFDATDPDMSGFARAGGKLILWHGLADPHIAPANTVALHEAMIRQMGPQRVDGFERLYLLPGVAHCGNGEGPSNLDLLSAMMAWVEQGQAPDAILTTTAAQPSRFGAPDFAPDRAQAAGAALPEGAADGPRAQNGPDGGRQGRTGPRPEGPRKGGHGPRAEGSAQVTPMSRPVYPYPFIAQWDGKGDLAKAESWSKGPATQSVTLRDWAGADLFGTASYAARQTQPDPQ
ncbi:tannase/feruloyl esterase family alpha/beta hydrolase [Thioclava sp. GXIMD4216]|uniref:tannase/feruloyl esterase family alpha/beta hydrolase n=1 Tax=Thioclava sp. GXIMD4216 TaxID=3131929 RepID=UPI0030CCD896